MTLKEDAALFSEFMTDFMTIIKEYKKLRAEGKLTTLKIMSPNDFKEIDKIYRRMNTKITKGKDRLDIHILNYETDNYFNFEASARQILTAIFVDFIELLGIYGNLKGDKYGVGHKSQRLPPDDRLRTDEHLVHVILRRMGVKFDEVTSWQTKHNFLCGGERFHTYSEKQSKLIQEIIKCQRKKKECTKELNNTVECSK